MDHYPEKPKHSISDVNMVNMAQPHRQHTVLASTCALAASQRLPLS